MKLSLPVGVVVSGNLLALLLLVKSDWDLFSLGVRHQDIVVV